MAPPYTEVSPSPVGEWYERNTERHFRATRFVECAWSDRAELITFFLSVAGAGYPHDDGPPEAFVRGIKPVSRGPIGGSAIKSSYTRCVLKLFYDTWGPRWVSDNYIEEKYIPETHRLRPFSTELYWSDDTPIAREEAMNGVEVMGSKYSLTLGRLNQAPLLPMAYMKMCNATPVSDWTIGYTWPPQTVLYSTPMIIAHSDYESGTQYTIKYEFPINPFGWNKFWHGANAAWESLYNADGDEFILYPADWYP